MHYFEGTITEIPNPTDYMLERYQTAKIGSNLYLPYEHSNGLDNLFKFDGTTLTEIAAPFAGSDVDGFENINGTIYCNFYNDNTGEYSLYKLVNDAWVNIPVPAYSYMSDGFVEYQGSVYFSIENEDTYNNSLFKYDGTTLTEIPNPVGFSGDGYGCTTYDPFVYENLLYLRYTADDDTQHLATFDGTDITIINSPAGFNYDEEYFIDGSSLYLNYNNPSWDNVLFTYNEAVAEVSAGTDADITCSSSHQLNGQEPTLGQTSEWTIVSGGTGTFGDAAEYNTTFTADAASIYILAWTIDGISGEVELNFVADTEFPEITCLTNQTFSLLEGESLYTVAGTELEPVSATDNCSATIENDFNTSLTLANAELSTGITTIVWTATDEAGNSSTCQFDVTVNAFVGILNNAQLNAEVFPNPTSGIFKLSFAQVTGEKVIEITDLTGKTIKSISTEDSQLNIDLTNEAKGVYFIMITDGNSVFSTKVVLD